MISSKSKYSINIKRLGALKFVATFISRILNPTEKDLIRLEKYKIRLKELRETLEIR